MNVIIDYAPSKKCVNPKVLYTCYKCNACGRFDKNTMWKDRRKVFVDYALEELEKLDDEFFQTELQQTNILLNVVYFANKAKESVKHIEWKND